MKFSDYTRNAKYIKDQRVQQADGSVITLRDMYIYLSVSYPEKQLAYFTDTVTAVGVYAAVCDDRISVSLVNGLMEFTPTSYRKTSVSDEDYYELFFEAGSKIMKSTTMVVNSDVPYRLYNAFFSGGNIPGFMSVSDVCSLFNTALKYSAVKVGKEAEVIELMVSVLARIKKDKTKYWCQSVKSEGDVIANPPCWIGFNDVLYAPSNTVDKVGGPNFDVGLVSSLSNPSERTEDIERLLRT